MALSTSKPHYTFKLLLCGEKGVGKAALIDAVLEAFGRNCQGALRWLAEHGSDAEETPEEELKPVWQTSSLGVDWKSVVLDVGEQAVEMHISQSGIYEAHRDVTGIIFRHQHAILVVFDVTNERSWKEAKAWCEKVDEGKDRRCLVFVVENNIDQEEQRTVSRKDVNSYCARKDNPVVGVFRTSPGDTPSVVGMFQQIAARLIASSSAQPSHMKETIRLHHELLPRPSRTSGSGNCCSG